MIRGGDREREAELKVPRTSTQAGPRGIPVRGRPVRPGGIHRSDVPGPRRNGCRRIGALADSYVVHVDRERNPGRAIGREECEADRVRIFVRRRIGIPEEPRDSVVARPCLEGVPRAHEAGPGRDRIRVRDIDPRRGRRIRRRADLPSDGAARRIIPLLDAVPIPSIEERHEPRFLPAGRRVRRELHRRVEVSNDSFPEYVAGERRPTDVHAGGRNDMEVAGRRRPDVLRGRWVDPSPLRVQRSAVELVGDERPRGGIPRDRLPLRHRSRSADFRHIHPGRAQDSVREIEAGPPCGVDGIIAREERLVRVGTGADRREHEAVIGKSAPIPEVDELRDVPRTPARGVVQRHLSDDVDVDVPARRPPRRSGHPVVPGGLCLVPGRRHLDRVSGEGRTNSRALIEVEGRAVNDRACGDRREVESEDGTRLRVEPVQDQGRVGPMVHVHILLIQPRVLADGRGRLQAEKSGRARGRREGDVAGPASEVHVRHVVRRREVRRGRAIPRGRIPFKSRRRSGDLGVGQRVIRWRREVPDRRRCTVPVVRRRRVRVGGRDCETRERS